MNELTQTLKWTASPWKFLTVGILFITIFSGALFFSAHSRLARFRADLRSRGFKLSLGELASNRKAPPWDAHEFVEALRELQQLNFPELGGQLKLMNLGPSATPVPSVKADKPFWAATDTNLVDWTWEDLAEAARQAQPALQRIRALARQRIPYGQLGNSPPFDSINVAKALCEGEVAWLEEYRAELRTELAKWPLQATGGIYEEAQNG